MTFVSVPSNLLVIIALFSLLLLIFHRRAGVIAAQLSLAAIVVVAFGPIGNALLTPLEQRFPEGKFPEGPIQGIIVLGGSYDTESHSYLSTIILEEDTEVYSIGKI